MAENNQSGRCSLPLFLFCSLLLGAGLLVYSQTYAFAWDEGFHLLAAKLVTIGRRPYLDFVHAQAPLNAYWNAFWMRIFGESWRPIQAIDALLVTGAVTLAAGFLRSRFGPVRVGPAGETVNLTDPRVKGWGAASVIAVFVLAGLNIDTVVFGPIAQAYPIALFLIVCAFRAAIAAVDRERTSLAGTLLAGLAGLLAGAAAGFTLLTAPVAPVLLIWMVVYSPEGKRLSRAAALVAGVVVAFLPLLLLWVQSPGRVIFGVLQYHMFYRRSDWEGATRHDLELLTSWVRSPQVLLLATLAFAGVWFVARKSGWDRSRRAEFYLCGWLALVMGLYVCTPHPTFVQYFIFTVPFFAILGSLGLFGLANQFASGDPAMRRVPLWPMLAVSLLVGLGLARELYDTRDDFSWSKMEKVAHKVNEVTPPGAPLYADETTYFLTHRIPPPGNEYVSSHKLRLAPAFSEFVHIIPQPEYDRRIAAGEFDTIESCDDEDWYKERKLEEIYRQKTEIAECYVFWDRIPRH